MHFGTLQHGEGGRWQIKGESKIKQYSSDFHRMLNFHFQISSKHKIVLKFVYDYDGSYLLPGFFMMFMTMMGFTFSFFPPQIASHCWNCHRWKPEKYGIRWSNKSLALHSSNPLHCAAQILSTVRHKSWAEWKDLRNLSWGWHSFQMLSLQITRLFAQSRLIFLPIGCAFAE